MDGENETAKEKFRNTFQSLKEDFKYGVLYVDGKFFLSIVSAGYMGPHSRVVFPLGMAFGVTLSGITGVDVHNFAHENLRATEFAAAAEKFKAAIQSMDVDDLGRLMFWPHEEIEGDA